MKAKRKVQIPLRFFHFPELFYLNRDTKLPVRLTLLGLLYVADEDGWFEWNPPAIQKALDGFLIHEDPTPSMEVMVMENIITDVQKRNGKTQARIAEKYRSE
ncbi:hypothetical protein GZ77_21140 [Endozoicomonas montiporae]|uniref:Uncharacterized protein n=3 Tax=Endozoicomonas montiporae TaxID=1027273 RepID=A0A081N3B6_9GAMM|nr:hypothetical protein [Endozoicomonas montiporae]AMO58236.1 hypothetical protein EZMO1_4319 [Endozoicomonas montiporae CL-33]KEQ12939.1 hypothetical protein GZ77_21140 [Endozoicomonas montiporae]